MSWQRILDDAPELAKRIWAPFAAERHAIMATLRPDGSPRLSGIEPKVVDGQLYLGSMPDSWKVRDLRRDPRFALHNSTSLEAMQRDGDAKLSGTAVEVTGAGERDRVRRYVIEEIDWDPGASFDLFRAEITEAALITTTGEEMVFDTWNPRDGARQRRRK